MNLENAKLSGTSLRIEGYGSGKVEVECGLLGFVDVDCSGDKPREIPTPASTSWGSMVPPPDLSLAIGLIGDIMSDSGGAISEFGESIWNR